MTMARDTVVRGNCASRSIPHRATGVNAGGLGLKLLLSPLRPQGSNPAFMIEIIAPGILILSSSSNNMVDLSAHSSRKYAVVTGGIIYSGLGTSLRSNLRMA